MSSILRSLTGVISSALTLVSTPMLSMTVDGIAHEAHCGQANGAIEVWVSGGTGPYSYLWSPTPPQGQGTPMISGLVPGDYTVTVTDALSEEVSEMFTVVNNPDLLGTEYQYPAQDGHANCPGHCWGEFRVPENYLPGVPPYSYSEPVAGYDPLGEPYFYVPGGACGGDTYQITVTDGTGCSGVMNIVIIEPQIGAPAWTVTNTTGSCTDGAGGTVSFTNTYDGNFWQGPYVELYDPLGNVVGGEGPATNNLTLTGLAPGHYRALRNWNVPYQYLASFPCDDDTVGFDIPDLGVACGTVSGTVFIDNDQDCSQDVAEVSVPELVLEIQPGPTYAITNATGHYVIDLADGSYSLEQNNATLVQLCPASVPVPFTIAGDAQVIDLADSSTVPLDLVAWMENTPARPGFSFQQVMKVKNLGPQISGPITASLTFDAAVVFSSSTITPTSVVGNTITWDLPALTAYGQHYFVAQFDVPAGTPIGTVLDQAFTVSNTFVESDLTNNTWIAAITVVGSFDPNAKSVATSTRWSEELYFIDQDQYLDYTIQFQNTGTDTAFTVVVTDTLPSTLDMGTFEQGVASHPFEVSFKPGRVVEWRFENILLPDSGTNEAASHGLVQFRIRPIELILPGTVISNEANIYFDFNEPVITEPSVLVAEFSTGITEEEVHRLLLAPVPVNGSLNITGSLRVDEIRIITSDGREAMRRTPKASSFNIDVSGLKAGSYLLIATMDNGNLVRERFIKQ